MKVLISDDLTSAYLLDAGGNVVGRWFRGRPDMSDFNPSDYNIGSGVPAEGGMQYDVISGPGVGGPAEGGITGGGAQNEYQMFYDFLVGVGFPDEVAADSAQALVDMGLDIQGGFAWTELAVNTATDMYKYDLDNAISEETNRINALQVALNEKIAETDNLYKIGMLEEAKLSREQQLLMSRELNELNKYIAEMVNQVQTLGLEISERAYGAQLGAHALNTVEYELWKRGGGPTGPMPEIPTAPVPQAPTVPQAPRTPQAPEVPVASTGAIIDATWRDIPVESAAQGKLVQVGEPGENWEYVYTPPGSEAVIAPHAKGERSPTMAGGFEAIRRQLQQVTGAQSGAVTGPMSVAGPMSLEDMRTFRGPLTPEFLQALRLGPRPERPMSSPQSPPEGITRPTPARSQPSPVRAPAQPSRSPTQSTQRRPFMQVPHIRRGQQGQRVPGMQGGGTLPGIGGVHTDAEMAAMLAAILGGNQGALYNPGMKGTGQFGEQIWAPNQVSRSNWMGMGPGSQDVLRSFLSSGIYVGGEPVTGPSFEEDWLSQMARSWVPGLQGAKKAVTYAF